MMTASAEVVALVTQNKFGTAAAHKFGQTSELASIVTEDTLVARQFSTDAGTNARMLFV
ncbi:MULTISPECIES: hypothetical protein [Brucella]|uniref:Uncharacterized protein n=2 Tax=Brucella TaxID=234 RepID=A0A256GA63_9HYPH|nr:hypothetical protein [Brucella pseudogrignonensis]OYR24004.1 hypothetical protein CEV34_3337 [Brucella pseudogrignonensis]